MKGLSKEQHTQDFRNMYHLSPLYADNPNLPNIGELLDIYSKTNDMDDRDFFTILHFSNWVQLKVKENHGIGLLFPTKEMMALWFVVEQVYQLNSYWSRDILTGVLVGGWAECVN